MTEQAELSNRTEEREVFIKRVFDAQVELVWKAWTDPEYVMRWWGPKDYTSPFCQIDLRVGGKYLFAMRAPDYQGGQDYYSGGAYTKIVPMQRLEFTQYLTDKDGNKVTPAQVGMPPDFPDVIPTVVLFKAIGKQTELTVIERGWTAGQMYDYSVIGMSQSLDKLAESLK
jgi:uncharacterized protein YndB with AHSA1/START domain